MNESAKLTFAFDDMPYLGIDMESVARFQKYETKELARKLRCFTEGELTYAYNHAQYAQHLAARFCAKEAAYKALSSMGYECPSLILIEVCSSEKGCPYLVFHDEGVPAVQSRISLSHTKDEAIAIVALRPISV